jgi:hypothetical protein
MGQSVQVKQEHTPFSKRIRGSSGRTLAGGLVGSAILGAASATQGDPSIGLLIGAIFGFIIGIVSAPFILLRIFRRTVPYFVIGAVVSVIFLILVSNSGSIEFGELIETDNNLIPVTLTAVLGGIIAVVISRGIARD